MAHILVVGLNPAWQSMLEFSSLRLGEVNRAETSKQSASGKGINAAKVLRRLGHDVTLLQILGGDFGRRCLAACESLGITSAHAWVETETRQCLTLLDRDAGHASSVSATEIIEPFAVAAPDLKRDLLGALPQTPKAFDALVISGSIPAGAPTEIYAALLERYQPRLAVYDSAQALEPRALAKIDWVKVNRREFEASESLRAAAANAAAGAQAGRGPGFLITDGGGETSLLRGDQTLRFQIPRLEAVRNPIGAGDTVTAGLTHGLLAGATSEDACREALAMGSASCLRLEPAEFGNEDYESILARMRIWSSHA